MDQNKKHEYKTVTVSSFLGGKLKDQDLNRLSAEGWELVNMTKRTSFGTSMASDYVFKRELKNGVVVPSKTPNRKSTARFWAWFFGILFFLSGFSLLFSSPTGGVFFIIASAFLLPPVPKFIKKKMGFSLSREARITGAIVFVILASIVGIVEAPPEQSQEVNPVSTATATPQEIAQQKAEAAREEAATQALKAKAAADLAAWEKTPAGLACAGHPDWDPDICQAIADKRVVIGMTKEQAVLSWGSPMKVNTMTNAYETQEQWVYGVGKYIYFENGLLTTIQD